MTSQESLYPSYHNLKPIKPISNKLSPLKWASKIRDRKTTKKLQVLIPMKL